MTTIPTQRRLDIDWLRIFATYMLFVFHGSMMFSPAPFFHIRNDEVSMVMVVISGFISLWHMPLFFLLAGWSVFGSIAGRGAGGFVGERFRKLAIPLVAGSITIGPVLKYFELAGGLDLNHLGLRVRADLQDSFHSVIPSGFDVAPAFSESFFEFLPTFFTDPLRFTWGHLWFIAYLFVFSVVLAPLFLLVVRARRNPESVATTWVYVPLIPLIAAQVFLRPYWPGLQNLYNDWANVAFYGTFFFLGFLLARFPAYETALHREARRAASIALATMLLLLLAVVGVLKSEPVILAGTAVAGWCAVVAILGFAHVKWNHENALFRYPRESAFPVYIFHQPALVLIGYVVIHTELGIAAKYILTLAVAVPATLAFYHFVLRRSRTLGFLYGLKPVTSSPTQASSVLKRATAVSLVTSFFLLSAANPAMGEGIFGLWWAEGGAAQVEIGPCEDRVCGRVTWLRSPFDEYGCALSDRYNPDPALRGRTVVGLNILHGFERDRIDHEVWAQRAHLRSGKWPDLPFGRDS